MSHYAARTGSGQAAANDRTFAEFERKHIDGREQLPWAETLPLAGMR